MPPVRTALGLLTVTLLGACAEDGGTLLVVLHNKAPDEGCVVTAVEGGTYIPAGRIDAIGVGGANPTGYLVTPLIKNLGDSQGGNLEAQRTVILRGARVELVLENSAELGTDLSGLTTSFTAPFSGAVSPDGGLVATLFELVPAAVIARVEPFLHDADDTTPNKQALISATFTVFGTMNNGDIEADAFVYPVTICYGCLNSFLGTCLGLPDAEYAAGGACNLYQDVPSQCCMTSTTPQQILCPAVPESLGE